MNEYLSKAAEIKDEIVEIRRQIHKNPEVGMDLPMTTELVTTKLREYGYEPKEICQSGVVATVGGKRGGKCLLLRADMDALPMAEESGEPFSATGNAAHTCGHDIHTANLLGVAKILKEYEDELEGTVKFMFQPDEETLHGAKAMVDAGLLENPKVDAGMSMHTIGLRSGAIRVTPGYAYSSSDPWRITVKGVGGHGSSPQFSVDPVTIASHIVLALEQINAREVGPQDVLTLTVCSIHGGTAPNIIPEEVILEGSMRTYDEEVLKLVKKRFQEITEQTAKTFRGEATIEYLGSVSATYNEPEMTMEVYEYLKDIVGEENTLLTDKGSMASEDFSEVSKRVPCTYLHLGTGSIEEGYLYNAHNPKVRFNEDAFVNGMAALAGSAIAWLKNNK